MSTIANAKKEARHDITMFKRYRNLLGELISKDVKLKYRNSWLGIFWSLYLGLAFEVSSFSA